MVGKIAMKKEHSVQTDIYGNTVNILNTQEVFRLVKCGRCKETVKSSQAKTHLSFGKALTLCNNCIKELKEAGITR